MLLLCGAGLLLVVVGTVLSFRDQHGYQSHTIHTGQLSNTMVTLLQAEHTNQLL